LRSSRAPNLRVWHHKHYALAPVSYHNVHYRCTLSHLTVHRRSVHDIPLPLLGHLGQLSLIRFQPLRDPIFQCQLASFRAIISSNHNSIRPISGREVEGLLNFISQFPHFLNNPSLPPPNLLFPLFNLQHLLPLSFLPPSFPFLKSVVYFLLFPVILMLRFGGDLGLGLGMGSEG
jgi:hypothetical protein